MTIVDNDHYHGVALWGPPASGKTWFIRSFAKRLMDYSKDDPDFFYEIRNEGRFPIDPIPPATEPTQDPQDHVWYFKRVPKKNTKRHEVSTHEHVINIHDDKGAKTIDLTSQATVFNLVSSSTARTCFVGQHTLIYPFIFISLD